MSKLTLKRIDVSSDVFNSVLERFPDYITLVDDIEPYYKGTKEKWRVYYCKRTNYIVCKECFVTDEAETDWKQVIVRMLDQLPAGTIIRSIDGSRAWSEVNKQLSKYYTEQEKADCLNKYQANYDERLAQQHYTYEDYYEKDIITRHSNCIKYDINGAHCDALRIIFPKAAKYFEKLYKERKINPVYKMYANYFVGMLARKGFRLTYNWIVQRTTKILTDAAEKVGGDIIYINTDGFAVSNPTNKLNNVKENALGMFKIEYEGDIYTYEAKNYWLMQCGNDMKGSALQAVRPLINLREGIIADYERKAIKNNDGEILYYQAEDIRTRVVRIKENG